MASRSSSSSSCSARSSTPVFFSAETQNLRASLRGGHLVLRNLHLQLDQALAKSPVPLYTRRAYADQLKLDIPWSKLSSQVMPFSCLLSSSFEDPPPPNII